MNFEVDHQTLNDLALFDDGKNHTTIHALFNLAITAGGKGKLYDMMRSPSGEMAFLVDQRESIRFFCNNAISFKINPYELELIEHYLKLSIIPSGNNVLMAWRNIISYKIRPNNAFYLMQTGVGKLIALLKYFIEFLNAIQKFDPPPALIKLFHPIFVFFQHEKIQAAIKAEQKLSYLQINKYDELFRKVEKEGLSQIMEAIYLIDAYIGIAKAAGKYKLTFPEYITAEAPEVIIESLFHPLVANAIPNDISINGDRRLCFLTGPNMAGKSTFLKSLGLNMYLAHIGFPVSAKHMRTTVFNGIVTTINISDDISKGYSHYYSEVRRVKETAIKIRDNKKVFVIFDELFRGTNVKDAYDASLEIILILAKIKSSIFFISTHIIEIADQLLKNEHVLFKCFHSQLDKGSLTSNYKINDGVSTERLGLQIVRQEKIIEILEDIVNRQDTP
jgi:peroxiredoxin